MAREMALAGVDPSELTPPPPPKKPHGFKAKWDNYWYHYKWPTIGVLFLLVVIGWLVFNSVTADPADYRVVVITQEPLTSDELQGLQALMATAGEDIDGDGKVEVTAENLNPGFYDELAPTIGKADTEKLMSYLATGERVLFLFDAEGYNSFMNTIADVTSEDYRFFAVLATDDADYNADEHYWSWENDARRDQPLVNTLPERMYFGVRDTEGTEQEQAKALLLKLIENKQSRE